MWSGAPNALPTGWALCDGTGTYGPVGNTSPIPDLRERFIVGAGIEPAKTVIDYSAPFTITALHPPSGVSATPNNIAYTIDTANAYYLDTTGKLRQGVNIDGYNYHLYKGPGSTSATSFKYIVFDNRYNMYVVVQGALPSVGSSAGAVIFWGDLTTYPVWSKPLTVPPGYSIGGDHYAEYTKYFTNGRRVAFKEITWATTTSTGYTVGDKGGQDNVVLLTSQMPRHQHDTSWGENPNTDGGYYGNGGNTSHGGSGDTDPDNNHFYTSQKGNSQPHENRPPYYALAFIIYTGV